MTSGRDEPATPQRGAALRWKPVGREGFLSTLSNAHLRWVGIAFVLWLAPSSGTIWRFSGASGFVILPLLALAGLVAMPALLRQIPDGQAKYWAAALALAALAVLAIIYPLSHSGVLGPGSDRADGLNIALRALLSGGDPYGARTYLGNPVSQMPGALVLALPFYFLGDSALQNLFWLPVFVWWCFAEFRSGRLALGYLLIFLFASPAAMRDFVTGGDYLINIVYVVIAMDWVLRAETGDVPWRRLGAAIFLSFAITSRPIYLIAMPILTGAILRSSGARRAWIFAAVVAATCALLIVPFYLRDPIHFPMHSLARKLASLPRWSYPQIVLPAIGLAISLIAFVRKPEKPWLFALTAIALAPALCIPVAARVAHMLFFPEAATSAHRHLLVLWQTLAFPEYLLPISLCAGLWLMTKLEPAMQRS